MQRLREVLSAHQIRCLAGQLEGLTVREIADRLGISHPRVVQHLQQARRNLARAGLPAPQPPARPRVETVASHDLDRICPSRIRETF